ncbi:hypothetical protein GLOTRDRAFT_21448, partial [Gloeophyllum trabeum ATCC 11539]
MTAHKAQGLSLPHLVIDLHGTRGTEAPYVMVSRATSLEGLMILRDFPKSKIRCHPSQEVRQEMQRLEILRLQTTM